MKLFTVIGQYIFADSTVDIEAHVRTVTVRLRTRYEGTAERKSLEFCPYSARHSTASAFLFPSALVDRDLNLFPLVIFLCELLLQQFMYFLMHYTKSCMYVMYKS
jgi:hypothetical protein